MKPRSLLFAAALLMAACAPKDPNAYVIKGEVKGLDGQAYVVFLDAGMQWTDDADVDTLDFKGGRVDFHGTVRKQDFATILYADEKGRLNALCEFYMEPGRLKITGDLSGGTEWYHAFVTGTEDNDRFAEYRKILVQNEAAPDATMAERESAWEKLRDASLDFISSNAASAAGVYALSVVQKMLPLEQAEELFADIPERYHGTNRYRQLQGQIEKRSLDAGLMAGKTYENTRLIKPDGSTVELSTVAHPEKYTLVEFWISHSTPSLAQKPVVRSIYEQYAAKGLDVVSISLDDNMGEWLETLEKERCPWTQLRSTRLPGGVEALFDVQYAPKYVLLAPGGEIVASGGSARAINVYVSKYFD